MTKARQETRKPGGASNVVSLHDHPLKTKNARHKAIQQHLIATAQDTTKPNPIASALAFVREDGTVDVWARGVERQIAPCLANALDDLSASLRDYAKPRTVSPWAMRAGYAAALATLTTATFFNERAWLDVVLLLTSGAISARLFSLRPRFRPSKSE